MKNIISILILICLTLPIIMAAEPTIKVSPEEFSFKYGGEAKDLTFRVCQDSGNSMTIPLVTEITTDTLQNMMNIKVRTPYQLVTNNCKDIAIGLSTTAGYKTENVIIKLRVLNTKYVKPQGSSTFSNVDLVKNQSQVKPEDIFKLDNVTTNYTNAQIAPAKTTTTKTKPKSGGYKFGTFSWVLIILVLVAVGFVIYQLWQWGLIGGRREQQQY